jgi:tRNA threonylcarbamoyladenosine modification (KEOPS) complex Cgi121 subunit
VEALNLYFTLVVVDPLPKEWIDIASRVKQNKKVLVQFFNHSSIVSELVPFLVYNVQQAFKYEYNFLKGLEQELLLALYGKRNFQDALSTVGASVSRKAAMLLLSERVDELEEALAIFRGKFSEKGSVVKPFENEGQLFTLFWRNLLAKEYGFKKADVEYEMILELVKERIAISYL